MKLILNFIKNIYLPFKNKKNKKKSKRILNKNKNLNKCFNNANKRISKDKTKKIKI